jgi:DNA polymerase IV (DinB-like DNA polymerase)
MYSVRVVIHIDFDYFFAQVEERENPRIKGKPVVVCVYSGRSEDSGVVSTANYEAREHGVNSGIPIAFAKRKLKSVHAVFLPVNHTLYDIVSERIMGIIRKYSDKFEQAGVDEAYIEVIGRSGESFEKARELAEKLKEEIFTKERITCSIGIGPNKLVAKIAAGRQKPNGLTIVTPEAAEKFLSPLPVRELIGVGRKTERVLHSIGIKTIGDLASYGKDKLTGVFGSSLGLYLHNSAIGVDKSPVEERRKSESVSRISTLKEDTRDIDEIGKVVESLAEEVHRNVVEEQGLMFKSVSLMAVMDDLSIASRSQTFRNPTGSVEAVKKTVKVLLRQFLDQEPDHLVRRVGVKISNLIEVSGQRMLPEFA